MVLAMLAHRAMQAVKTTMELRNRRLQRVDANPVLRTVSTA